MKLTNEAWTLYREKLNLQERDRARVEGELSKEEAKFNAMKQQAGGDDLKALGLFTLQLATDMAKELGIPEHDIIERIIAQSPRPEQLRDAIRQARSRD